MAGLTRRTVLAGFGAGAGLLGLGYALRGMVGAPAPATPGAGDASTGPAMTGPGMMGSGMMGSGMMGGTTPVDMSTYMDMFNRHSEITRSVTEIPGGIRTTTESDAPDLVAQLQAHVSNMYAHLEQGAEVSCMSRSLPTLFRHAEGYHRQLTFTPKGVAVEETATDPTLIHAIRAHASEVTGFVREGMPAMMKQMMGPSH
jgi:hypothetical protein